MRFRAFVLLFAAITQIAAAQDRTILWKSVNSSSDPRWEGYRNTLLPANIPNVSQNFGFSPTTNASRSPGEIGGPIQRSVERAFYALPISPRDWTKPLSASGTLSVTKSAPGSGLMFGWFNEQFEGWPAPNSLAFHVAGEQDQFRVFVQYGTAKRSFGGSGCFEGETLQTTTNKALLADASVHHWSLSYNPQIGSEPGLITFTLDQQTYSTPISYAHKAEGARFNRFGLFNVQLPGAPMEAFIGDLVLAKQPLDLHTVWKSQRNKAQYPERAIRPCHHFGYVTQPGTTQATLGGIIWNEPSAAYYADKVGPFTADDELFARGKIKLTSAAPSGAVLLGWFDSRSKTNFIANTNTLPANTLAVLIENTENNVPVFQPTWRSRRGTGETAPSKLTLPPDGKFHLWSLHYLPQKDTGSGEITLRLDDNIQVIHLRPEDREPGATFDRFGIFNQQTEGQFLEFFLEDLTYSGIVRVKNE